MRTHFLVDYQHRLRLASQGGRLTGQRPHPSPDLQRVYEAGFDRGRAPTSLDPYEENPHPPLSPERGAWLQGWLVGAESVQTR